MKRRPEHHLFIKSGWAVSWKSATDGEILTGPPAYRTREGVEKACVGLNRKSEGRWRHKPVLVEVVDGGYVVKDTKGKTVKRVDGYLGKVLHE